MKDYRSYSDNEVVLGIRQGDRLAFKALYHNRTAQLKRYITENGGSESESADIEQKAIIVLYEKIISNNFTLNIDTKLSTYLYAVARNLWLKEKRQRSKEPSAPSNFEIDQIDLSDVLEINEDSKDKEEQSLILALAELGDVCQKILKDKYYHKKDDKQISEELGNMTYDNVRKRRHKCMAQLKKIFIAQNKNHG